MIGTKVPSAYSLAYSSYSLVFYCHKKMAQKLLIHKGITTVNNHKKSSAISMNTSGN